MIPPIGSHMSIAGGVDKAPARGHSVHCKALQIFVKNNNRWEGPPISPAQAANFAKELDKAGIPVKHVFAHTSYLINLGSPNEENLVKSTNAMVDELERCELIKVPGLVMHPGSPLGGSRDEAVERIATKLKEIIARTPKVKTRVLLETTAGMGSHLGGPFEDLRDIMDAVGNPDRVGVCLDTCHIFAAGYDIRTPETYKATFAKFDKIVGFKHLHAVHLNDSKHALGSHKDRHEHVGKGLIGEEAFRLLMTDPRVQKIPMSLETEKLEDLADDRMNLATLYRLAGEEYPG